MSRTQFVDIFESSQVSGYIIKTQEMIKCFKIWPWRIVRHGSVASGSTLISCQSGIPSASTIENVEEEASAVQAVTVTKSAVQTVTEPTESAGPVEPTKSAGPVEPAAAEQAEEIAKTEVTHRGYRNT